MKGMSDNAPLALFIYNRPVHLRKTIASLSANPELADIDIYVFCDGPREERAIQAVKEARKVAREHLPPHAVFVYSDINKGLAVSIEEGVKYLCEKYGKVIVIEDDLQVSSRFLCYMNTALNRYEDYDAVMQISGYWPPGKGDCMDDKCVFLPATTSWGWATWMRAWERYDPEVHGWSQLESDRELRTAFNLGGAYDYYTMLKKQVDGAIDSWAIRWYWGVFKNSGVVLYPPCNMVRNIGFDGSGTHGWRGASKRLSSQTVGDPAEFLFPDDIGLNEVAFTNYINGVKNMKKSGYGLIQAIFKACTKRLESWR